MCKKVAKKVSGHDTMTMVKRRPAMSCMAWYDHLRFKKNWNGRDKDVLFSQFHGYSSFIMCIMHYNILMLCGKNIVLKTMIMLTAS